MQKLSDSVGEAGKNARHDVALIQAGLALVQRPATVDPKRSKYLSDGIDGSIGNKTYTAIRLFQSDQVFVNADGTASQVVAGATPGRIVPGDVTYTKLAAAVPRPLADLRALAGSKIVYVAATIAQRDAQLLRVGQLTFEASFAASVAAVIKRLYEVTGIACGVCRNGDRRTFQTQYEIYTAPNNVNRAITGAGPGESNHNYGQAVDLGFQGLRWLRPNGTVEEGETSWLHKLDPAQHAAGEALIFWKALRDAGIHEGLFRGPENDRPHLQAWSDKGIDMADRLARLLSTVGSMKWTGRNQQYSCDFGLGGACYPVGSAVQIWGKNSQVTKAALATARSLAPKNATTQMKALQRPVPSTDAPRTTQVMAIPRPSTTGAMPAVPRPGATGSMASVPRPTTTGTMQAVTKTMAGGVTDADVTAMKEALYADCAAADAAWSQWRAR